MNIPGIKFKASKATDITAKTHAFKTLFGESPALYVSGDVVDTRGTPAFLRGQFVKEVGRVNLTIDLGEEGLMLMSVKDNAQSASYTLRAAS